VYLSTCLYNSGFYWTYQNLLVEWGINVSPVALKDFRRIDNTRIVKSEYQTSDIVKQKRKETRREKKQKCRCFSKRG